MATIREFITEWGFEVDERKLAALDKRAAKINKRLEAGADMANRFGRGLTFGLTLPIVGAAAAAVKLASDADETNNKFQELFGSLGPGAEEAATRLSKSFKLAESTSKDLLSSTGDILQGFGLTEQQALELSETVQGLSADIASFKNVQGGTERASRIITKALVGERVALKESLGTQITQEEVQKRAIKIAQQRVGITVKQAEAFALVELVQEKNKKALGDFNRTLDGGANSFRVFQELLKSVAEKFGKILLPPALKILSAFNRFLMFVDGLNPALKTTILIIGGVAAAIGPLLLLTGLFLNSLVAIRRAMILLRLAGVASIKGLLLPFFKIIAVAALVFLVFNDLYGFFTGKRSLFGVIIREALEMFNFLEEKFNGLPGIFKRTFALIMTPIRTLIAAVRGIGGALGAALAGDVGGVKDAIFGIAKDIANPLFGDDAPSLSGALGFGSEQTAGQQIGSLSGVRAVGGVGNNAPQTNNITNNIEVKVPEGTDPKLVPKAIEKGVAQSLDERMRFLQRQVSGAVVN